MLNSYVAGSTSVIEIIDITDPTSSDGDGLTGLLHNTTGLQCYYKRSNGTASVVVTLANITTLGTFVSGGFKQIDATNLPGAYEFHPPNAAFASGAKWVVFYFINTSTGIRYAKVKYRIVQHDPDLAVHPTNLTQIDGLATNANLATLKLKEFNVTNNAGAAVQFVSSGGSGNGLYIQGNGATTALRIVGGATGPGIWVSAAGNNAAMFQSTGSNGLGLLIEGHGTGSGMKVIGGATGHGVEIVGGSTSGNGIGISTTDGHGISIVVSDDGINIDSGSIGCRIVADSTGILIDSGGDSPGVNISGSGSASGVIVEGGATGTGVIILGGDTSGIGLLVNTTDGTGVLIQGNGAGSFGDLLAEELTTINTNVLSRAVTSTGGSIPITAGGKVSADATAISGSTNAADNLKYMSIAVTNGAVVADGANTASTFKTNLSSTTDDFYGNTDGGGVLVFTGGANVNQARRVTSYAGATTKFITVESPFASAPADTDPFIILGRIET